jgi:catechol 2,3-dioxygenase-like lactoylglutathione lyase family enzyme
MLDNQQSLLSSGITFVGVRTQNLSAMAKFMTHVLGFQQTREEPGFLAFRTPTGQRVELFDEMYAGKEHFKTGPVPGFEVTDFDRAVEWLDSSGLEVLCPPTLSTSGTR